MDVWVILLQIINYQIYGIIYCYYIIFIGAGEDKYIYMGVYESWYQRYKF